MVLPIVAECLDFLLIVSDLGDAFRKEPVELKKGDDNGSSEFTVALQTVKSADYLYYL